MVLDYRSTFSCCSALGVAWVRCLWYARGALPLVCACCCACAMPLSTTVCCLTRPVAVAMNVGLGVGVGLGVDESWLDA